MDRDTGIHVVLLWILVVTGIAAGFVAGILWGAR